MKTVVRRLAKPARLLKETPSFINALRLCVLKNGAQKNAVHAAKGLQAAPFLYVWLRNFCVSPASSEPLHPRGDVVVFGSGYGGALASTLAQAMKYLGDVNKLPAGWIEAQSEAPATALGLAAGLAVARSHDQTVDGAAKVWCVLGQEAVGTGEFYEAAQFVGANQNAPLICLLDATGVDAGGMFGAHSALDIDTLLQAFGWLIFRVNDATDLKHTSKVFAKAVVSTQPVLIMFGTVPAHGTAYAGSALAYRVPPQLLALDELAARFEQPVSDKLPAALVTDVAEQVNARWIARNREASALQQHAKKPSVPSTSESVHVEPKFNSTKDVLSALIAAQRKLLVVAPQSPVGLAKQNDHAVINATDLRTAAPAIWRGLAFGGAGIFDYVCDAASLVGLATAWRLRKPPTMLVVCIDDYDHLQRYAYAFNPLRTTGFNVRFINDYLNLEACWKEYTTNKLPTILVIPPDGLVSRLPLQARRDVTEATFCVRTLGLSAAQNVSLVTALDHAGQRYAFYPQVDPDVFGHASVTPTFCVGPEITVLTPKHVLNATIPVLVKSAHFDATKIVEIILGLCAHTDD